MMNRPILLLAIGSLTISTAAYANNDGKLELSGQFGIVTSGDGNTVISPRILAFIPVTDSFAISGDLGLGVLTDVPDGQGGEETEIQALNIFLGGHFLGGSGPLDYRVGLGIALPTSAPDTLGGALTTLGASSPRGLFDFWLYTPKTVSVVAPAHVEIGAGIVTIAGDGAIVLYIPEENGDPEFGFQLAGDVLAGLGLINVGVRLQLASVPTSDVDLTQISLMPYLQFDLPIVYARAGLLFNLDEPFGPSFDDGRPFGIDIAVGATW